MKVYQGLDEFKKLPNAVVTSGTFDGVHIGHQKILQRLREIADNIGGETVLITYWPHPRLAIYPNDENLKLISTIEEKIDLLRKHRVDHLVILAFTKEFSQLTSEEFIRQVLIDKIGTRKLVIGYDHRFGKNREGSFEHLKANAIQYGIEVEEIPRQDIDDVGVSSTHIRQALQAGMITVANESLGSYYSLTGTVTQGNKLGRTMGYPTANIRINDAYKLIPADGVYAVYVYLSDKIRRKGMMNIGVRPTVDNQRSIEVNIFDFDESIYDQLIRVELVKLIRREQKFASLEALKEQLHLDKVAAEKLLS
jgi:riboflavin kinase/FMN adenylyltransferase